MVLFKPLGIAPDQWLYLRCRSLGTPQGFSGQMVAAQLVGNDHVERRRRGTLFHVSAHMEARRVRTSINQLMNGARIAVKGKHDVHLPRKHLERFDELIGGGGLWNFFLIFLLPVFPDDAACFLAGLTRLSIWKLAGVAVIGRLPGMAVLAFIGTEAGKQSMLAYVVLGMALSVVLWLYSDEAEAWLQRKRKARFHTDRNS